MVNLCTVKSAVSCHARLLKNSSALASSAVIMSVLGVVYWAVAARLFTPEDIGLASAFLAFMYLIGLIGDGGLGSLLVGELARWQDNKGLISASVITCLI